MSNARAARPRNLGSIPSRGKRFFYFTILQNSKTPSISTRLPIQWGPTALSLGVKRPEREADQSSASDAEVKNKWSCTSILPCTFPFMTQGAACQTRRCHIPETVTRNLSAVRTSDLSCHTNVAFHLGHCVRQRSCSCTGQVPGLKEHTSCLLFVPS